MILDPKVTVVIPVYNVEKYISYCAKTLFAQTFNEIEYIFINDGSSDDSIRILEEVLLEYPHRKSQVIIIKHFKNQGVASARNTGLIKAHGEYILQADSDDWVEPSMIEELYKKAKKNDSDMVWSDFYVDHSYDRKNSIYRKQDVPESIPLFIKGILSGDLHGNSWNKLMRRSLCSENDIHFPEGVNMREDEVFIIFCLLHAQKISYLPSAFYHYMQNANSITASPTRQSVESEFKAVEIIDKSIPKGIYSESLLLYKARIKTNFFLSGLCTNKDFACCYPETDSVIIKRLNSKVDKMAIWFAVHKLFLCARIVLIIGQVYYKIKQFILK